MWWYSESRSERTDESGRVRFEDLLPGTFWVYATPTGSSGWHGCAVVSSNRSTSLTVSALKSFPLRVRILTAQESPLAGIRVVFEQEEGGGRVTSFTDDEGRKEFAGFDDRPGTLAVESQDYDGANGSWVFWSWKDVAPGPLEQTFFVPHPARVRGRFSPPSSGEDEKFTYTLSSLHAPQIVSFSNTLSVAADGSFEIEWAVVGTAPVALTLSRSGLHNESIVVPELDLAPGEERDLGIVRAAPGIGVSGVIQSDDGKALAGARIAVSGQGDNEASAKTDERGIFHLEDVFVGPLHAEVDADGWYVPIERDYQSAKELNAESFVLVRMAILSGRIQSTSAALEGAPTLCLLGMDASDNAQQFVLNQDGSFVLHLAPGTHRILFRAFGDLKWTRGPVLTLAPGAKRALELDLP